MKHQTEIVTYRASSPLVKWRTQFEGEKLISQMTTEHLVNVVRFLERRILEKTAPMRAELARRNVAVVLDGAVAIDLRRCPVRVT